MCEIKEGDEVYLAKGGKVFFKSTGHLYDLSNCKISGGRIIVGIEESDEAFDNNLHIYKNKNIKKRQQFKKGKVLLEDFDISLGDLKLKNPYVEIKSVVHEKKLEEVQNKVDVPITTLPFAIAFSCIFYLFKKISGLDRKLNAGTCEVRHAEAIKRIASLEGKVLRKQIIDGGKAIKNKIDKNKTEKS